MRAMNKSKKLVWLFCFLLMYFFIQTLKVSYAEEKYPTRTIKYVVPTPAGGTTDTIARKTGELISKSLGQEIIIDNRSGAGGIIGATYLAKSKSDGYTIGSLLSSTINAQPFLTKLDFDPITDFTPIGQIYSSCKYLYVKQDSPIKTFKDFIEEGRKRQILVGGTGMTYVDILFQHLAINLAKINVKIVPFGGISQCVAPLLGGQVDGVVNDGLGEYVSAGKMRIIARLGEETQKEYKNIPHVKEFGYNVNYSGFLGIWGPKDLPRNILMILEEQYNRALHNPSVIELIEKMGNVATYRNSEDFGILIKEEFDLARTVFKESELGIFAKEKK